MMTTCKRVYYVWLGLVGVHGAGFVYFAYVYDKWLPLCCTVVLCVQGYVLWRLVRQIG